MEAIPLSGTSIHNQTPKRRNNLQYFQVFLQLPDFNDYGVIKNKADLDKGLLVYGDYGVGKSTLFEAIHEVGKIIVTKTRNTQLWFPRISTIHMLNQYYESQKNPGSNFKLENYCRGVSSPLTPSFINPIES